MNDPLIRLIDAGVCYPQRALFRKKPPYWALRNVTFDLFKGETLGVIGRNGAGKSSLLKLLAGIIAPDSGRVISRTKKVAMLSLQVGFLPNLTGRDNIYLSGLLLGLRKREIAENAEKIIEFAEIEEFIDQPLHTYSTGMRARLGFSVALQADPEVLLIDEILGVGDAQFREKSTKALQERIKSNRTVVLVSHQLETLRMLCNRAVWIDNHTSQMEGAVDEVLSAYAAVRK